MPGPFRFKAPSGGSPPPRSPIAQEVVDGFRTSKCVLRPQRVNNQIMPNSCAFCGSTAPLTREHVFGQWVSKIGLDLSPAQHHAGSNNGLHRDMGTQPPYRQTVKNFCATCNNGWMSELEVAAQRVLTPLILGNSGTIALEDQAVIAMWAQKTALTAMLISSEEQRDGGYGLPQAEYRALYKGRDRMQPLDGSLLWVGRYQGHGEYSAIRVMPLSVRVAGMPKPDLPAGYALTIVLGELVLQGVRFDPPDLAVDVTMDLGMPQLWPSRAPVQWPGGEPCTEVAFLRFSAGRMLRSTVQHLELHPWTPAAELPQSVVIGDRVELPALCEKHALYYPVTLLGEVLRGRFYAFAAACECPVSYLIQTEPDGAHCKAAGEAEWISTMYKDLPGDEVFIRDQGAVFVCKRLPTAATTVAN